MRVLGKQPPAVLTYELFLDEDGRKISKSVGKGLSVDHWVDFAPIESLLFYLYQNPKRAKRLYWDVVPKRSGRPSLFGTCSVAARMCHSMVPVWISVSS